MESVPSGGTAPGGSRDRYQPGPRGYGLTVSNLREARFDTVVLDVDGTLVDSVYAHVWSWREAFRRHGLDVPAWRIHRAIGMGGDRLVTAVTNAAVERTVGDQVRAAQKEVYRNLADHLVPTPGAEDLLSGCKQHGLKVAVASSGSREDTEAAIVLLEGRHHIDVIVTGDDTDATKPDTEPVQRALDRIEGETALVVGDATWDMESARRAGHAAVGLLTGGVGRGELLEAGAALVFEDPAELAEALADLLGHASAGPSGTP